MTDEFVPEADAQEQSQAIDESVEPEAPKIPDGVPEADALEQAMPVPYDDEDDRR
ncbi:MAG TPA: hypothetical protein VKG45_08745 [Actinomycetes bacterium]|nr:hypothetical protein [Actinomycetes bacterium]